MSDLSSIHDVVEGVLQAHGFEPAAVSQAGPDPALSPFNLAAALAGAAFIHRHDAKKPRAKWRVSREIRVIEHAEHPAYLVWSDEWLPYSMDEAGEAEMGRDFLMVPEAPPYLPKTAVCEFCERPIVQWIAKPDAAYVHTEDRLMFCGIGGAVLDMRIAEPAPGTVVDPNQKAVQP